MDSYNDSRFKSLKPVFTGDGAELLAFKRDDMKDIAENKRLDLVTLLALYNTLHPGICFTSTNFDLPITTISPPPPSKRWYHKGKNILFIIGWVVNSITSFLVAWLVKSYM